MTKILTQITRPSEHPPEHGIVASAAAATGSPGLRTDTRGHRRNIEGMSADDLEPFREALRKIFAISDDRGYQYFAGLHGLPLPVYCKHGSPLFAIWHRPYLYFIEKAMQDQVRGVTLPYWDWTSPRSLREGMPKAYTDERYTVGGQQKDNPLFKAKISFPGSDYDETFRDPGNLRQLTQLANGVRLAQRTRTGYVDYSRNLESPHNGLHGYVGGTMGDIGYAAYDPIFWAHHSNVDRLFSEWQAAHPEVGPPSDLADVVLQPFNVTVKQVWSIRDLGYDYVAGSGAPVAAAAAAAAGGGEDEMRLFNGPIATFLSTDLGPGLAPSAPAGGVADAAAAAAAETMPERVPSTTAYVKLHGLEHPEKSFEIRVFLNQPDAGSETPTLGNPHFAGSIHLFGHGRCVGEEDHCDPWARPVQPNDIRPPHHLAPMTMQVDASEAVARVAREAEQITVSIVAVDPKGKLIENPGIAFDSISIDVV